MPAYLLLYILRYRIPRSILSPTLGQSGPKYNILVNLKYICVTVTTLAGSHPRTCDTTPPQGLTQSVTVDVHLALNNYCTYPFVVFCSTLRRPRIQ